MPSGFAEVPTCRSVQSSRSHLARAAGAFQRRAGRCRSPHPEIDRLAGDLADLDRDLAREAVDDVPVRRLQTITGVNAIVASGIIAAVGDIRRFREPQRLVSYFGLNSRVRQSGLGLAQYSRISRYGRSHVPIASGKPLRPSTTAIRMSATPRFFSSVMTRSQILAPSFCSIQMPRISLAPSGRIPSAM